MIKMMQSIVQLLEFNRFNALIILFTLILHERFLTVCSITVNLLDPIAPSSNLEPEELIGPSEKPHEFTSEIYDFNNIDYSQLGNDFNKFTVSMISLQR